MPPTDASETRLLVAGFTLVATVATLLVKRKRERCTFQKKVEKRRAYEEAIVQEMVNNNPERLQVEDAAFSMLTTYTKNININNSSNNNNNKTTAVLIHGVGCTALEFKSGLSHQLQTKTNLNVFDYDRILFVTPNDHDYQGKPRDASTLAQELHALLQKRNISPPYLLIGHSYGGLIAQWFAHLYTTDTKALVLMDPAHEDQFECFPQDFAKGFTHAVPIVFRLYRQVAWTGVLQFMDRLGLFNFPPTFLMNKKQREACVQLYSAGHAWNRVGLEFQGCLETFERMKASTDEIRSSFRDTIPVALVIAGHRQYSPTLFPKAVTKAFLQMHSKSLPDAKVFMAPQSDHWMHLQEPHVVLEAVKYVLNECQTN